MNYFVVGDIHGCYYTLLKLLKEWNKNKERLVFVGDYINKGKHSKEVVGLIQSLQKKYQNTIVIKGNHEYQMVQYILNDVKYKQMKQSYQQTLQRYDLKKGYKSDLNWMNSLPMIYEDKNVIITHSGINRWNFRKFNPNSKFCVLHYRGKLKRFNRLQIIGHTPTHSGYPEYTKASHSINVDSGAGNYHSLSAVYVSERGELIKYVNEPIDKRDKY